MATRSPVRLVKKPLAFGLTKHAWTCEEQRLGVAEFQNRDDPTLTAIVHRSTKQQGGWQTSFFRDGEPISDIQAPSCDRALYDGVPNRRWRLRNVIPR